MTTKDGVSAVIAGAINAYCSALPDSSENRHILFSQRNGLAREIVKALSSAGLVIVPGWRPIETHPGDMGLCILTNGTHVTAGWFGDEEGWFDWEGDPPQRLWQPTHWMPLPASPAMLQASQKDST